MTRKPKSPARPRLTPAQQQRLLTDVLRKASSWGGLLRIWMSTFVDAVERVALDGEAAPFASRALMWIRLYGVLDEVLPGLEAHEALSHRIERLLDAADEDPVGRERLATAIDAVRRVRASLSADELLFVAYARHHEAHPFPYLDATQLRRGGLLEKRLVLGNEHDVGAIRAASQRVLFGHGADDARVASTIAQRLLPLAREAAAACGVYALAQ